jgi:hypothetical protein
MLYGTICHLLQKTHEQLPREVIFQGHLMPRFSLKQDKKKKKKHHPHDLTLSYTLIPFSTGLPLKKPLKS